MSSYSISIILSEVSCVVKCLKGTETEGRDMYIKRVYGMFALVILTSVSSNTNIFRLFKGQTQHCSWYKEYITLHYLDYFAQSQS